MKPNGAPAPGVDRVAAARASIHRAAVSWSPVAVLALGYLVDMGEPLEVLRKAREATAEDAEPRGQRNTYKPTTAAGWAIGEVVSMWRSIGRARGIAVLPAPMSVHDSIAELDRERPEKPEAKRIEMTPAEALERAVSFTIEVFPEIGLRAHGEVERRKIAAVRLRRLCRLALDRVGDALSVIGPAPKNNGEAVKILPSVNRAWDALRVALDVLGVPEAIRAALEAEVGKQCAPALGEGPKA